MAHQILQVNFSFSSSAQEYKVAAENIAAVFAALPGLLWKIWLFNEQTKEGGGIYLFESREAADAYRSSDLFNAVKHSNDFTGFIIKQFDTLEAPGLVTHAPMLTAMA